MSIDRRLLALLALSLCACRSTADKNAEEVKINKDPKPIQQLVEDTNKPESIGKFLTDLDGEIRAWTKLMMTASTPEERQNALRLDRILSTRAHARRSDLIEQLQAGPTSNRVIAATALGFTHEVEAQGPLLAALQDPANEVVGNALLGLMILGLRDTPLDRICPLLESSEDTWVRANAAQCIAALVQVGARSDCARTVASLRLTDPEPGVRSQCALILAASGDVVSLPILIDMLHDATPLVSAAAARSVAWLGHQNPELKGRAARGLVAALDRSTTAVRGPIVRALAELSGVNYGANTKEWEEWSRKLP